MEKDLEKKYRASWEKTLQNRQIAEKDVSESKFFFEITNSSPVPKHFDTYGIVCCLPFPEHFKNILEEHWKCFLKLLSNPVSYGVEPQNRHVEIFLFQRPEEISKPEDVKLNIEKSLSIGQQVPVFKIYFCYPFITPDGTIVVPGFNDSGTIEEFRSKLRESLSAYPKKQSQWLHTSLGRILQPLDENRLKPLLKLMESHWGQVIGEVTVDKLLWTKEKQWYMVDKEILSTLNIKK
jgi:hypothetical protein